MISLYTQITVLLFGCCSLLCAMEEKSITQYNSTGSFIPFEQIHNEAEFQLSRTARKKLKRQQRRDQKYAKRNQKQESTPQQSFNQFVRNRAQKTIDPRTDETVQESNPLVSDTAQVLSNADQTSSPLPVQEKDTTQKTTTSDEPEKNATWSAWFVSLFGTARS